MGAPRRNISGSKAGLSSQKGLGQLVGHRKQAEQKVLGELEQGGDAGQQVWCQGPRWALEARPL